MGGTCFNETMVAIHLKDVQHVAMYYFRHIFIQTGRMSGMWCDMTISYNGIVIIIYLLLIYTISIYQLQLYPKYRRDICKEAIAMSHHELCTVDSFHAKIGEGCICKVCAKRLEHFHDRYCGKDPNSKVNMDKHGKVTQKHNFGKIILSPLRLNSPKVMNLLGQPNVLVKKCTDGAKEWALLKSHKDIPNKRTI